MVRWLCGECQEPLCKELTSHDGCGQCHNPKCKKYVPMKEGCGI